MFLCETKAKPSQIIGQSFQVSVSVSIREIADLWQKGQPADNIFLQTEYLSALEHAAPANTRFCYAVLSFGNKPCGVVYTQIMHFDASQSFKKQDVRTFGQATREMLARMVRFDTLICGNMLLTGQHGFYFHGDYVPASDYPEMLEYVLSEIRSHLLQHGINPAATVVKDFYATSGSILAGMPDFDYVEYFVQPSMVMTLNPAWTHRNEYIFDLASKYRVRAKRAFKKGENITRRELNVADMRRYQDDMYALHRSVVSGAGFNAVSISPEYMYGLKNLLPDAVHFFGYFLDDRLIGFYTLVENHAELEAHCIGYDKSLNHDLQIYLNMLLDMVGYGIEHRFERIIWERTATEIKSSVGAEPHDMALYFKHRYHIGTQLFMPIFRRLYKPETYVIRRPFREE